MDKRQHDIFYNVAPNKKDRMDCLFDQSERRNFQQIIEEEGINLRLDFTLEAQTQLRLFPEFDDQDDDVSANSDSGKHARSKQRLLQTFDDKPTHLRRFSQPHMDEPNNLR